ncbi:MAG: hypothetical protein JO117_02330, partial [Verrucomicrobia bacterium]|nr:hypothetical protein [Verrucomicrobiota bacterium]
MSIFSQKFLARPFGAALVVGSLCSLFGASAQMAAGAAAEPLSGRWYLLAKSPANSSGNAAQNITAVGTLDLLARPSTVLANWHLESSPTTGSRARNLRGFGLPVEGTGDNLLAISLRTGGPAYGVTVYQREGPRWHGRWVTSIDSARTVGEMWIENPEGPLAGKHRFTGERSGTGHFEGVVSIAAKSDEMFTLTYAVGGVVVYRALGVLLAYQTRLAVAWSYGSAPALAIYRSAVGNDGAQLTGRQFRLARGGDAISVEAEQLARNPPGSSEPTAPGGIGGNELFSNEP